jgi:hypothetical protein
VNSGQSNKIERVRVEEYARAIADFEFMEGKLRSDPDT